MSPKMEPTFTTREGFAATSSGMRSRVRHRRHDIRLEGPGQRIVAERLKRAALDDARVVDENVERSSLAPDAVHDNTSILWLRDVRRDDQMPGAGPKQCAGCFEGFFATPAQGHRHPSVCRLDAKRATNTGARAGDENELLFRLHG